MKALRYVFAIPVAILVSFLAWALLSSVFTSAYGGSIIGLAPIGIRSGMPTILFITAACWIFPSVSRKWAFIFFALALLFSGGGVESLHHYQLGILQFWLVALISVVAGALIGLVIALRFRYHYK